MRQKLNHKYSASTCQLMSVLMCLSWIELYVYWTPFKQVLVECFNQFHKKKEVKKIIKNKRKREKNKNATQAKDYCRPKGWTTLGCELSLITRFSLDIFVCVTRATVNWIINSAVVQNNDDGKKRKSHPRRNFFVVHKIMKGKMCRKRRKL